MESLLLLHGAVGSGAQLQPLASRLATLYDVHIITFSGHGGSPMPHSAFSIQMFAADVLNYMSKAGIEKACIFGYSMGGYVGMYMARHYADKVSKIVTLATKFYWDAAIAAKEVQMLDPAKIETKLPSFAETLEKRHAPEDWKDVLKRTALMMTDLGSDNALKTTDHAAIHVPSLLMLGDRDKMVSIEETLAVYRALPSAQLCILPGTPHPIEQMDIELVSSLGIRFLTSH